MQTLHARRLRLREIRAKRGLVYPGRTWPNEGRQQRRREENKKKWAAYDAERQKVWAKERAKKIAARRVRLGISEAKIERQRQTRIEAARAKMRELAARPGVVVLAMDESETARFGPDMAALPNDRWRAFVIAYVTMVKPNAARAYRQAYPDVLPQTARSAGSTMLRDLRIKKAIREEGLSRLESSLLVKSLNVAEKILDDPAHPRAAQVAFNVMDRAGMHPTMEHKLTAEHKVTIENDPGAVLRIKEKLEKLGIDPVPLLGSRLVPPRPTVTDAEFEEVK